MFPTDAMPVLIPMPISSTGHPSGAPVFCISARRASMFTARGAASLGVIGLVERRAPDGHHRVTDVFIERALMAKNDSVISVR